MISARSWTKRLDELNKHGRLLEAQRLEQRTNYDLEMMQEMGYAPASKTIPAIWQDARPVSRRLRW